MQNRRRLTRTLGAGATIAALAIGAVAAVSSTPPAAGTQPVVPHGAKPLSEARILFELNATAKDAGVQALVDGEGWRSMRLYDPNGKELLRVRADGPVGQVGVTELFFESAEPSLSELPLDELLTMYPEGDYTLLGKSVEGDTLVGVAPLTHDIPGPPKLVGPKNGATVDRAHAVVTWKPPTKPSGSTVDHYQIIVETVDDPLRIFAADVGRQVSSVAVPPTFLQRGTEYKLEVQVIEENLNQTIIESTFRTK